MQLHDTDGDLTAAKLTDSTIVHFLSQTATAKAVQLGSPGQILCVQGAFT